MYQSVCFCQYKIHSAECLIFSVDPGRWLSLFCAWFWNFAPCRDVIPPPGNGLERIFRQDGTFPARAGGIARIFSPVRREFLILWQTRGGSYRK
jgi:hypothetical protein